MRCASPSPTRLDAPPAVLAEALEATFGRQRRGVKDAAHPLTTPKPGGGMQGASLCRMRRCRRRGQRMDSFPRSRPSACPGLKVRRPYLFDGPSSAGVTWVSGTDQRKGVEHLRQRDTTLLYEPISCPRSFPLTKSTAAVLFGRATAPAPPATASPPDASPRERHATGQWRRACSAACW